MKLLMIGPFFIASALAIGQDTSDLFDKAPPPIDEALRARVKKFFQAEADGKFTQAYEMVAEEARDEFISGSRDKVKSCEIVKINYSENFTKAAIVTGCKGEWNWHGQDIKTQFPLTSHWKLVNGDWYWYYVRPTEVPFPFSPTGYVKVPSEDEIKAGAPTPRALPDPMAAAKSILAQVKVDKTNISLKGYETSKDELHVVNGMPGQITLSVDPIVFPGLKITPDKTQLQANEKATVVFEYRLDDATIECGECAKRVKSTMTAQLHIQPTGQLFPITITFGIPPELEKQIPKQ